MIVRVLGVGLFSMTPARYRMWLESLAEGRGDPHFFGKFLGTEVTEVTHTPEAAKSILRRMDQSNAPLSPPWKVRG